MCRRVFNKTIILLGLAGYEMIITNSALRASLVIYQGALAMTTATTRKTSLGNKYLPNCDCPTLFAFYNVGKVRYNWIGVCAVKLNTEN